MEVWIGIKSLDKGYGFVGNYMINILTFVQLNILLPLIGWITFSLAITIK